MTIFGMCHVYCFIRIRLFMLINYFLYSNSNIITVFSDLLFKFKHFYSFWQMLVRIQVFSLSSKNFNLTPISLCSLVTFYSSSNIFVLRKIPPWIQILLFEFKYFYVLRQISIWIQIFLCSFKHFYSNSNIKCYYAP